MVSGGDDSALHAVEFSFILDNDIIKVDVTREASCASAHTSSVTGKNDWAHLLLRLGSVVPVLLTTFKDGFKSHLALFFLSSFWVLQILLVFHV